VRRGGFWYGAGRMQLPILMPRRPPKPPQEVCPPALRVVFGASLRAERIKLGMTQPELAARLGLKAQYVGQIELGRINVSIATMEAMAAAVGLEVSVMLHRSRATKK
jgi:DNA-binding XRE family transcriptional regulator